MATAAKTTRKRVGSGRGGGGGRARASGQSAGSEEASDAGKDLDKPIAPELPEERDKKLRTPGFTRMRFTWRRDDHLVIKRAQTIVNERIIQNFLDAYEIMNAVYDIVRDKEVDVATGEIKTDMHGFAVWKRKDSGAYDEDFTRLTLKQKEDFMFRITTRLFDWEQRAADAWLEAMMAKTQWEERFAIAYDTPASGTIEDLTAQANIDARDEKYFAIFVTTYSRKADALVRTMSLLGQRLKDSME
jgi:hypothetical protein